MEELGLEDWQTREKFIIEEMKELKMLLALSQKTLKFTQEMIHSFNGLTLNEWISKHGKNSTHSA